MDVFKPNIRGLPKRRLSWGIRGWRFIDDGGRPFILEFNFFWQKSWPLRIDEQTEVHRARNGTVHLARPAASLPSVRDPKSPPGLSAKWLAIAGSLILAALSFLLPQLESAKEAGGEKLAGASVAEPTVAAGSGCVEKLAQPDVIIDAWLQQRVDPTVQITELANLRFGGMQKLKLTLTCEQKEETLIVTLTQHENLWRLNKIARLEN